ncbi:SigE family RNA polymerase sigma factor [Actinocorallia sp. A-T 12471]|uniref:SigE family RNA polymerase sigma factor n=1 Tax=Actinocorallia sp. A-T 12471 TaxID=3089813 RepID=UPI0029D0EC75|nr:SigE family RNA polymerase sigma factor [Actinocorallia sp. A-T 12471]MDX6741231.1 SigE family RNA polymerase sigma factor [Actinocorallia sp. A-T 12471]
MADEEAFRHFVAERSPALLRLAYLLTADRANAEDLVQNALVKAYLRWKRIETNPEAYVRRILVTVAADERRRPHRRHETATEAPPELPGSDPFAAIDGNVRLRAALAELPAGQRAAVVLRHWVGLEVAEVAELLGCSPGTVRSQTLRGLDKLREAYGTVRDDAHG